MKSKNINIIHGNPKPSISGSLRTIPANQIAALLLFLFLFLFNQSEVSVTAFLSPRLVRHQHYQHLQATSVKSNKEEEKMDPTVVATTDDELDALKVDYDTRVSNIIGQPQYSISSIDISRRWIQLVQDGKVSATVQIPYEIANGDGKTNEPKMATVQYGVRLNTKDSVTKCEEFVIQQEDDDDDDVNVQHELVRQINSTLSNLQQQQEREPQDDDDEDATLASSASSTVNYRIDQDGFVAQLQLVRTLRPPPSPGFATSTTSEPPVYDETTDSFITGKLRLQLRPLVATLSLCDTDDQSNNNIINTPWDVYHNVSPADSRGHFLIIPTLNTKYKDINWRGQLFTKNDCHDVVHLASTITPVGSIFIGYNSVGAGASQNHIHCHIWPCPPMPLLKPNSREVYQSGDDGHNHDHEHSHDDDMSAEKKLVNNGWDCYPVSNVKEMYDICDVIVDDEIVVEVSYLKYPVFCVQLSSTSKYLKHLGEALATTLETIGTLPYNIGFLNRPVHNDAMIEAEEEEEEEEDVAVDVFLFVRSKERSDVLPSLKLGVSEMMGIFHAQSDEELELLVPTKATGNDLPPPMVRALEDISYDEEVVLWDTIKSDLSK